MLLICSQVRWTEEIDKQAGESGKVAEPVVLVLSVKLPSALAIKVPVVVSEPTTGTLGQPRLARVTSISPDSLRHDDVTLQAPTTLPPQGESALQLDPVPAPPLLLLPPFEPPPMAGAPAAPPVLDPLLHPAAAPNAASMNTLKSPT